MSHTDPEREASIAAKNYYLGSSHQGDQLKAREFAYEQGYLHGLKAARSLPPVPDKGEGKGKGKLPADARHLLAKNREALQLDAPAERPDAPPILTRHQADNISRIVEASPLGTPESRAVLVNAMRALVTGDAVCVPAGGDERPTRDDILHRLSLALAMDGPAELILQQAEYTITHDYAARTAPEKK